MSSRWLSEGATYRHEWGGRAWSLRVDGPGVGLRADEAALGPLLGLDGLKDRHRADAEALGPSSLIEHEALFNHVEATYAPAAWDSLRVRATWSSRRENAIDLEVQAQAFTVGDLESVEVGVMSRVARANDLQEVSLPDDAVRAGIRRPGSTLPIPVGAGFPPLLADFRGAGVGLRYYLELIHPDDAIRRELDRASGTVRYALFGYDLERGVIVRGRLRGIWLATRPDVAEVASRVEEFLSEPPPLGT